ncbi:hypothetical protein AKUH3B110M_08740 [Apilactobacillus kunkeei]|nr:hypothetical protein AKUG0804_08760 [Apilactobacillus kunkeei]CAI2610128.1 hypothetical protein AKUH3B207X_08740 [Apilactobacillus kunkeei]CAI2610695.1 hypothetical protein AKUG0802_08740 [Apilactobacillus kunkeei]CAI2610757.1 hypothetical protein AKUG0401_08760 [Apilactobacillus kunkeei]CAI2611283.1 hypothetical protein AKUG0101_08810 [Apilactobacillus kunkeei]
MYSNRSMLYIKKASSIFIKLICTLINFSLIVFTMFGVCSNRYSAETYSNNLKIDLVIVIQLLFVVLALIQIISFFIRKVDLKKEAIISLVLFILGFVLYILQVATMQFLACILIILLLLIIDKKVFSLKAIYPPFVFTRKLKGGFFCLQKMTRIPYSIDFSFFVKILKDQNNG